MKEIIFRPDAEDDIDGVWDHTAENWGRDQANAYVVTIRETIEQIALGRKVSRTAESVRVDYRQVQVRRHVVFFRETEDRVEVVRVLQGLMDVGWV